LDIQALETLVREFEGVHQYSPPATLQEFQNPTTRTFGGWADWVGPDQMTRLWYVSDGNNLCQVTFVIHLFQG
jgi:hypothetical protein